MIGLRAALPRLALALGLPLVALATMELVAGMLPGHLTASLEVVAADLLRPEFGMEAMVASEDVPGWDLDPRGGLSWGLPFEVNRWRMRGPEYGEEKGAGVVRIVFTGDSAVFGQGLRWEETAAAHLARILEAEGPGLEVQPALCAAPGHSSAQSLLKLQRHCLAFQPDVVVIGNLNSDSTRDMLEDTDQFPMACYTPLASSMRAFALYRLTRNSLLRWGGRWDQDRSAQVIPQHGGRQVPGGVNRVPLPLYRENLSRMVEATRSAGAEPLLLILPHRADAEGLEITPPLDQYREAMAEVALELGVPLADAASGLRAEALSPDSFLDPVHPGPQAAALIAEVIAGQLAGLPPL